MSTVVEENANVRIHISKIAQDRDPMFKVTNGDWWTLFYGLFNREYKDISNQREMKKDENGKFDSKRSYDEKFFLRPEYFEVFKSNADTQTGRAGGRESRLPHEYLSRWQCVKYFVVKNAANVMTAPMMRVFWVVGSITCAAAITLYFITNSYLWGSTPVPTKPKKEVSEVKEAEEEQPEAEEKESEAETVEQVKEPPKSEVVAMGDDEVIFESGLVFKVGEKIDDGQYKGKIIVGIDRAKRRFHLSDGSFVQLGWSAGGLFSTVGGQQRPEVTEVQRDSKPGSNGQQSKPEERNRNVKSGVDISGRLGNAEDDTVPSEPLQSVDDSGKRFRQDDNKSGGKQRTFRPTVRRSR